MKGLFGGFGPQRPEAVMPGPKQPQGRSGPGIHVLAAATKDMDGRDIRAKTRFCPAMTMG
jgi:hypothetical protein